MRKKILFLLVLLICFPMYVNAANLDVDIKSFTKGSELFENFTSVTVVSDGFVMVGRKDEKVGEEVKTYYVLTKYNFDNEMLWEKKLDNEDIIAVNKIREDNDGNLIVVGNYYYETNSYRAGNSDAYIYKLDNNGNIIWFRTGVEKLESTEYERYVAAGFYDVFIGEDAYYVSASIHSSCAQTGLCRRKQALMRVYDFDGNIITSHINGTWQGDDYFYDSILDKDKNMYVVGQYTTWGKTVDGFIVKYLSDGTNFSSIFEYNGVDVFHDVELSKSNNVYAFGYTNSTNFSSISTNGNNTAIIVKYMNSNEGFGDLL